jgi:hypothetical protein
MQRHTWHLVVWSVVTLIALVAIPRASAQTGTVRCESQGNDRQQCAVERDARVELARQLSETPCRERANWGAGPGFIWVSGGCRAEFLVTATAASQGNGAATPIQLRACQSEADRRLPNYTYQQIRTEPYSRQGNTSWVRWQAGSSGGRCLVEANGRILEFTTEGAGAGGAAGGGKVPLPTTKITCESRGSGRQECPIPDGAEVRLVRQLSQNPCRLNDTYGKGAGYVWVAEGCRGEFEATRGDVSGGPPVGSATRLTCESTGNGRRECPIPPGSTARLLVQTSEAPCRPNRTYGIESRYVWVSDGCRGTFEVTRGAVYGGTGETVTRITCESQGAVRQRCPVPGATQMRLVRQLSTSPCRRDQTYGIGSGDIWVSNGCRGEFDVTVVGALADGSGLPESPGLADRVTCVSNRGERAECRIRSGGRVRLVRQLSSAACTRNSTWGNEYDVLWVTRGCRGEFEVR